MPGLDAVTTNPSGALTIASPWLIHTACSTGRPSRSTELQAATGELGAPVLAAAGLRDLATELLGDELRAVTDAEHRDARVVDRGVDRRRVLDVHRRGTTREDDRPSVVRASISASGIERGTISRVHVRFAHASCDQLRVLRTEVDDENGIE